MKRKIPAPKWHQLLHDAGSLVDERFPVWDLNSSRRVDQLLVKSEQQRHEAFLMWWL